MAAELPAEHLRTATDDEIVARARGYPFARSDRSVVVVADRVVELRELDPIDVGQSTVWANGAESTLEAAARDSGASPAALRDGRRPILAYGSNASPAALRWEFPRGTAGLPLLPG